MKTFIMTSVALASLALAGAASAQELTNQNIDTYFSTGNSSCCWATNTVDGVQLGLKMQTRGVANAIVPTGDLYTETLGTQFNIDYSVDPSQSTISLTGVTYSFTITDLANNLSATYDPSLVGDNSHNVSKPGAFQNSEFPGFALPFMLGSDYDPSHNDTYKATLTASGGSLPGPFTDTIYVAQGTGLAGFTAPGVPEPASWALMIMGFGTAGALLRRRRQQTDRLTTTA